MLQKFLVINRYTKKLQSRKKIMGQSKEIKQKRKGPENLKICFSVIFNCYGQVLISGRKTGH